MVTVAEAFVTLRPDMTGFASELERGVGTAVAGAQRKVDGSMSSFAATSSKAGLALSAGVTAPIVGIGLAAFNAASDFESAFAGVAKTVDATEAELSALRQGIRDMAKDAPTSAVDIAKVAEAAGQLGIKTENILEFTRVMVDLGNATDLTADQAATNLAQFANIIQLPQDQFDELGATIVDLGNKGASTESQIVEMAQRIAGSGHQIGLSAQEILAFASAAANVGLNAELGGSAISRLMTLIQTEVAKGGPKLELLGKTAGMTGEQFAQAFKTDAAGAIAAFVEGLGDVGESGGDTIGILKGLKINSVGLRDTILRLAGSGDQLTTALGISNEAWEENTALQDEVAKRYATTESKIDVFKNRLNDLAITLGDALIPALLEMLDASEPLITFIGLAAEGFANLPGPVQTVVIALVGITAIIGPLLLLIGGMAAGFTALIALGPALGIMFGVLLGPIGLVILALAALALGIYLAHEHWDEISAAAEVAMEAVADAVSGALDWVRDNWPEIATILAGPFGPIVLLATDAWGVRSALEEGISALLGWVDENWPEIVSILAGPFTAPFIALATDAFGVRSAMEEAMWAIFDFVTEKIGWVVGIFLDLPGQIDGALGDLWTFVDDRLHDIGRVFEWLVNNPIQWAIDAVWRLIGAIRAIPNPTDIPFVGDLLGSLSDPAGTVGGWLGGAKGIWKIPGPHGAGDIFPAMLAPGEMVLTANDANIVRAIVSGRYGSAAVAPMGASSARTPEIPITISGNTFNVYDASKGPDAIAQDWAFGLGRRLQRQGVWA